ncbi:DNA polymerase/3'-5' exonuclease PolX [Candidatus Gottesmanbacteria bacterium]|nr:DNA polymerase/3'-5' exonuclease PolX [Candidatus Gottesmanbacteria bacterium]
MTNKGIASLLRKVAAAYILKDENRFKIIAYEKAAEALENSTSEAKDLWREGKLTTIPGIGKTISSHLDELFRTGKVAHFESVFRGLPAAMFPLLEIPGFGAKKAYKMAHLLSLKNPDTAVDDLLKAAQDGKIALFKGFGEKSQSDIIESIQRFKKGQVKENRMPLPFAYVIASEILEYLKLHKDTKEAVTLGSLRRMVATIGDIDIAVSTKNPSSVVDWFLSYPKMGELVEKGPGGATMLLTNGHQVDMRVQSPDKFGAMLQYFTGSKNHNIKLRELALKKGLSLNEYGMKPIRKAKKLYEFANEKDLYNALDLSWVPPELREDRGEVEVAAKRKLPKLLEVKDIKGDLHIHSNYNLEPSHDLGSSSLEVLIRNAEDLKYEYIGISDHNPSFTKHTPNQIISILKARRAKFEQYIYSTKSVRVQIFIMLEVDILPDGKIPIPEEAFEYLDAIIVSIHSSFHMDKEQMTQRIISGLSHKKAKIFAHPTGRLIGSRDSYQVNWEEIFQYCQKNDKALEINAHPTRLDLPDGLVYEALKKNVKLVIDTDSHDVSQMTLMKYGVSVARRGWAEKSDILNTMPYNKLKDWLTG